ncbi:hypothetical protein SKAU_G00117940 [Synaphobranchus kaupii]|uniref:Uncharacterized protein n=1 Tax=Synaphobranchus kaupii TaxID=118154 RepID=A0A9Q1FNR2_SYNKA|nr:hypothetical protein SKAU_G00117940 [Synaphobranchus kaupii]
MISDARVYVQDCRLFPLCSLAALSPLHRDPEPLDPPLHHPAFATSPPFPLCWRAAAHAGQDPCCSPPPPARA